MTLDKNNPPILNNETRNLIRSAMLRKPSLEEVEEEIRKTLEGKLKVYNINRTFFRDLMFDVRMDGAKYSVNEVLYNDELFDEFVLKALKYTKKENPYPTVVSLLDFFGTFGAGFAKKPSNFPLRSVNDFLKRYNFKNRNYLDISSGWGIRMLGALNNGFNYYGIDPNHKLIEKLEEFYGVYKTVVKDCPKAEFFCQGSETFIPELKSKIGVVFSSPPYFDLEDYVHGEDQSIKKFKTYDEWLEGYWGKTVKNLREYLVNGGIIGINVKRYKKYDLFNDMKRIIEKEGCFTWVEDLDLKITTRTTVRKSKVKSSNEKIMVFCKGEYTNIEDEWIKD